MVNNQMPTALKTVAYHACDFNHAYAIHIYLY